MRLQSIQVLSLSSAQPSIHTHLRTASIVAAATRLPVTALKPYMPYFRSVVLGMTVSLIAALLGTRLRLRLLLCLLAPDSPAQSPSYSSVTEQTYCNQPRRLL